MKNRYLIYFILAGLLMGSFFSVLIHGSDTGFIKPILILVDDIKIYDDYGFKDIDLVYKRENIVSFDMPFIVTKTDFVLSKNDLSCSVVDSDGKSVSVLSRHSPIYSYRIIAENKNYYVINFHMDIKASNESFSVDFIPKIKDFSYSKFEWWSSSWLYHKTITINHEQVIETLTNFPVLFDFIDVDLKNNATVDGGDIVFINENNLVQYNHEIEIYNSTVGHLVTWVNITVLSSISDTIVHMYYGNNICSNQQNIIGTWNSNFMAVYHMSEISGDIYDSTGNNRDSNTVSGVTYGTIGKVGKCLSFDGNDYVYVGVNWGPDTTGTISAFAKPTVASVHQSVFVTCSNPGLSKNTDLSMQFYNTKIYVNIGDGTIYQVQQANTVNTNFNFVAITTTGSNIYTFLNNLVLSYSQTCNPKPNAYQYAIGKAGEAMAQYFTGSLDEIRVSSIARSNNWLNTEYNTVTNATNGIFYTISGQDIYTLILPNATSFLPINNSVGVFLTTNFSCYIYNSEGVKIYYTLFCTNGYYKEDSCFNSSIYLNFTNYNFIGWYYTVYINLTSDNVSYHNYYIVFRTITSIGLSESDANNTYLSALFQIVDSQLFLFIVLGLWLFFISKYLEHKDLTVALMQFGLSIPLCIVISVISMSYAFGYIIVFLIPIISLVLLADGFFYSKRKR